MEGVKGNEIAKIRSAIEQLLSGGDSRSFLGIESIEVTVVGRDLVGNLHAEIKLKVVQVSENLLEGE